MLSSVIVRQFSFVKFSFVTSDNVIITAFVMAGCQNLRARCSSLISSAIRRLRKQIKSLRTALHLNWM